MLQWMLCRFDISQNIFIMRLPKKNLIEEEPLLEEGPLIEEGL